MRIKKTAAKFIDNQQMNCYKYQDIQVTGQTMKQYKWVDPPGKTAFPVAAPGHRIIIAAAFVTAILAITGCRIPALVGLIITGFVCWFFRDPDRMIPVENKAVVSPADGKIVSVQIVTDNPLRQEPSLQISIFMSVLNVHVNRIPYSGTVEKIDYYPGTFLAANLDKASEKNERNAVLIKTENQETVGVVQIAGFVARRIICDIQRKQKVEQGQRFGMICFGSRLDLYLPPETKPTVSCGEKVRAGNSIVAYLP